MLDTQIPDRLLLDYLQPRSVASPVWLTPGRVITAGCVRASLVSAHAWRQAHAGRRVGLVCLKPIQWAWAFLLLDGVAASVVPVPVDVTAEQRNAIDDLLKLDTWVTPDEERPLPPLTDSLDNLTETPTGTRVATVWVLATSGTTGTPKFVAHTLATLTRTTKTDAGKGGTLCWGLLYELNRFAGLQVYLQALLGGSALAIPDDVRNLPDALAHLAASNCNAVSATPTLWRKIMMLGAAKTLHLTSISVGGETADDQVLGALSAAFPYAKIRHIYASTEAGVGFAVTDGRSGFPVDWLRNPPPGIELGIRDEDGMLRVRVPGKQSGTYIGRSEQLTDRDGWIETGDLVAVRGNRIHFCGRKTGAINVGGSKVHPHEVEQVIRAVTGVADVIVRARPSSVMGNLVEALVAPTGAADEQALKAAIKAHCRSALEPWKVPAVIQLITEMPTGATGKALRSDT